MNFVNFVVVHKKGVLNLCFFNKFTFLCDKKGIAYTRALIDSGLSKALYNKWKNKPNTIPNGETLVKLSKFFNVPIDYFSDDEQKEKAPTQTGEGLTDEQSELVRLFREADPVYRAAALSLLREAEAAHKAQDGGSTDL